MRQNTRVVTSILPLLCWASIGCAPPPQQPIVSNTSKSIELRLVATLQDDEDLVHASSVQDTKFVQMDEKTIGEWLPMGNRKAQAKNQGKAELADIPDAVTRQTDDGLELLVVHTKHDVSRSDITGFVDLGTGQFGHRLTRIDLSAEVGNAFFAFTVDHIGRNLAVVVDGELKATPKILSPIRRQIILSPTTIDKVRVVSSAGGN